MSSSPLKAQSPDRVASVLLAGVILTLSFHEYIAYGQDHRRDPTIFMDVLNGTATAPSQYRIGVLRLAAMLSRHSPLAIRHGLVLIETVSAFVAVFVLFTLLRRSAVWQTTTAAGRWFGAIVFVFLVQYYFAWVMFFDRPETLPTAALVSLVLLLISVRLPLPDIFASLVTATLVVLLALMQGFIRADVAFGLNAGLILFCVTRANPGLALGRLPQIFTSALAGSIAFAVQYYLMRVVYPHATYGDTALVQLPLNFESPGEWPAFTFFIIPFAWTVFAVSRRRAHLAPGGTAMLYASLTYLVLWFTFGRMEEVRIFLPFALAVAPSTVAAAIQRLFPDETQPAGTPAPYVTTQVRAAAGT